MAVSQFDKVLPWDPINYFQVESSLGKDRLDRRDKQDEQVSKLSSDFGIEPGPSTRLDAQKLQNDLINPGLDDIANSIKNGDDIVTITKKKRDLAQRIKQDQGYWNIQADQEFNKANDMWKTVANPEFNSNIQEFYDPKQGFVQNQPGNVFNPQQHYSNTPIVDINQDPEIQNIFTKIKPELDNQWGKPYLSYSYAPDGSLMGAYRTTEGIKQEKIDKNTIRTALSDAVQNNPHFIDAYGSLRYNRAYNNKTAREAGVDYQYTPEQAVEDLTDAFIGKYEYQQDLAPKIANVPLGNAKTGSGSGTKKSGGYDPVLSAVEQVNTNGYAKVTAKVASALLGAPEPDAEGRIPHDLNGTNTIISLGRTTGADPNSQKEIDKVSQLLGPLGTILRLRDKYDIPDDQNIVMQAKGDGTDYQWGTQGDNYYDPGRDLSQDPQYQAAIKMANDLGYDLNDVKQLENAKSNVNKTGKKIDPKSFSLTADNLGEAKLIVRDGPNLFTGDDGSMYMHFDTKIKATKQNEEDLKAAEKAGIATSSPGTEGTGDNAHDVTYYNVPVIKKVNKDIKDVSAQNLQNMSSGEVYMKYSADWAKAAGDAVENAKMANQFQGYYPHVVDGIQGSIQQLVSEGDEVSGDKATKDLQMFDNIYAEALKSGDQERIRKAALKLLEIQKNLSDALGQ